jgi:hypothetical protein
MAEDTKVIVTFVPGLLGTPAEKLTEPISVRPEEPSIGAADIVNESGTSLPPIYSQIRDTVFTSGVPIDVTVSVPGIGGFSVG